MTNKYLLVNLDTNFIDGGWEETAQPKKLKKYFNHILLTEYSYEETMDQLKRAGFNIGDGGQKNGKKIDSFWGCHLLEEILEEDNKKYPILKLSTLFSDENIFYKKRYIDYEDCKKIIAEYGENYYDDMYKFDQEMLHFFKDKKITTNKFEKWIGYPLNMADFVHLEWVRN